MRLTLNFGRIYTGLRFFFTFVLFQLLVFVLMWLLYLQYPTMQTKMKLAPPSPPAPAAHGKVLALPSANVSSPSPEAMIACAGLPVALVPGFSRNYTLEISQPVPKNEAKIYIKQLAEQGFKAYYLPAGIYDPESIKIRTGFYKGKPLALIKANMLRIKTNLNFAAVALP